MKYNAEEFYPTPERLLDKATLGVDWKSVQTVLEPEAGKGNIVDYAKERYHIHTWRSDLDVDCIEIDEELRSVLKGKGHRVVHDDFLTFQTFKKYDLVIMNPPFSNGAAHLLKALDIQKDGGGIICILNAETIRNPYTNERKVLVKRLEELEAEITYYSGEFSSAERPTDVEVAVVKVFIPEKEQESFIYEGLRKKNYQETVYQDMTDLAPNDFIEAAVRMYNTEVESGVRLIQEYKAMCPHIMDDLRPDATYKSPILTMKVIDKSEVSTNAYVREVRRKYWYALFNNPKFTGQMTSNLSSQYHSKVRELVDYDFSYYNIKSIQIEMSKSLIKGIEDCIVELFDKLSHQYAYSDELQNNIHYYNGWKTNKAWYINKKVIIPYINAFSRWDGRFDPDYHVKGQLMDIEKALNYLDGGLTDGRDMEMWLDYAKKMGQTRKIQLKYFTVTFYKKGTCHLEFTNEELLKKLNIFGCQQKGWLPPGYGKKKYQQMEPEERAVVDEFEGKDSYEQTVANANYYIYTPESSLQLLEVREAV